MPGRDSSVMADGLFLFCFFREAMKENGKGEVEGRVDLYALTEGCSQCYGVMQVFLK